MASHGLENSVVFVIGTGRCGTHFIDRVMKMENEVTSWHERHPISDAIHRYFQWYGINVDNAGFIETKRSGIYEDIETGSFSFEASAYLSLSVKQLYDAFDSKFILLVRRPDRVVNSYIQKGFYKEPLARYDYNLPAGYQPGAIAIHHPFSRIAPIGEEALKWHTYSQVGKLAWFWQAINNRVLNIFQNIPRTHSKVVRLEDLSYKEYLSLTEYIGFKSSVTEIQFNKVANKRPGSLSPERSVHDWNHREITEFESEVGDLAAYFDYEWRVKQLCKETSVASKHKKPNVYQRVRNRAAHTKRVIMRCMQEL